MGRPAGGRDVLTVDRILATALHLVDEHGLDALSMRRLARELDVDPMSIYHHVPNKKALVSGLVDRVFTDMRLPSASDGEWRDQVLAWVRAYHDLTRAHPHLVLQIVTDPTAVDRASGLIDDPLHRALRQAGVPEDKLDACAGMFVDFVNGHALAGVTRDDRSSPGFDICIDVMLLGVAALVRDEG